MFNPTRAEARNFLFEAWRKHRTGESLTQLEGLAVRLIETHPEFHGYLTDADRYLEQDYLPGSGTANPFLHLMMHLTIEEQISINQPPGIREHFLRLSTKHQSEHEAQHAMMECLAEALLQAQRSNSPPDGAIYLECLEKQ
jgi:hypothetical protein